jgi:hypothetical protein
MSVDRGMARWARRVGSRAGSTVTASAVAGAAFDFCSGPCSSTLTLAPVAESARWITPGVAALANLDCSWKRE